MSGIIRTGYHAVLAPYTPVIPLKYKAIRVFIGCLDRACSDTYRVVTVVAKPGNENLFHMGVPPFIYFLYPHSPDTQGRIMFVPYMPQYMPDSQYTA